MAGSAAADGEKAGVLAQAARQLLLAQSSDWQFMISTGAVPDYAEERFNLHCDDLEALLPALESDAPKEVIREADQMARGLEERDGLFPDILDSVVEVLKR